MHMNEKTAGLAGRDGLVVSNGVEAQNYPNHVEIATGIDYAAAKLTTRFRLRIETARLVCRLSGLGGAV